MQAGTGGDRYAGWTLVVAYEDLTQPPRNLTVDDGFITVSSGSPPITIPVSGFRTPPTGPVRTTLGFVAYEGDAGLTGDSATLSPNATGARTCRTRAARRTTSSTARSRTSGSMSRPGIRRHQQLGVRRGVGRRQRHPSEQRDVGQHPRDDERRHVLSSGRHVRDRPVRAEHHELEIGRQRHPSGRARSARRRAALHGLLHEHRLRRCGQLRRARCDPGRDDLRPGQPPDHCRSAGAGQPVPMRSATTRRSSTRARGRWSSGSAPAAMPRPAGASRRTRRPRRRFDVTINADVAPGQQIVNQATATFTGSRSARRSPTSRRSGQHGLGAGADVGQDPLGQPDRRPADDVHAVGLQRGERADRRTVTVTDPFPPAVQLDRQCRRCGWNCAIGGLR